MRAKSLTTKLASIFVVEGIYLFAAICLHRIVSNATVEQWEMLCIGLLVLATLFVIQADLTGFGKSYAMNMWIVAFMLTLPLSLQQKMFATSISQSFSEGTIDVLSFLATAALLITFEKSIPDETHTHEI